ncbi:MAG: hypothetical protein KGN01_06545 [Patescibacteria group bacterium]|nr:hypothetical protein [Patescibacteria group bacterium]
MTLDEKVDKILTNHLPHVYEKMAHIDERLSMQNKIGIAILVAVISVILKEYFKI